MFVLVILAAGLIDFEGFFSSKAFDQTVYTHPDCGISQPVTLHQLANIELVPVVHIDQELAHTMGRWLDNHVQSAAHQYFGQNIKAIRVAASYVCRTRNNKKGAKISEHGFGRALDIASFQLQNGTWIDVQFHKEGSAAAKFQRDLRTTACRSFSTVLGPGSDEYHHDHLHLDIAPRFFQSSYCR